MGVRRGLGFETHQRFLRRVVHIRIDASCSATSRLYGQYLYSFTQRRRVWPGDLNVKSRSGSAAKVQARDCLCDEGVLYGERERGGNAIVGDFRIGAWFSDVDG